MILPATYATVLLTCLLALLCWGLWAGTFKKVTKRRFELYNIDFALGAMAATLLASLTLGTLGGEITTLDNLTIVARRDLAWALAAGAAIALANMLLVATTALGGIVVAFSLSAGTTIFVSSLWSLVGGPRGGIALRVVGGLLAALAAACIATAFHQFERVKAENLPPPPPPKSGRPAKMPPPASGLKGILLGLASGLLYWAAMLLFDMSRRGIITLEAYGGAVMAILGFFAATLFFSIWFINLPVQGDSIRIRTFTSSFKNHAMGWLGGGLWCGGLICYLAATAAPPEVAVGRAHVEAFRFGAFVLAALAGGIVWKELVPWPPRLRLLFWIAILLLVVSIAVGYLLAA